MNFLHPELTQPTVLHRGCEMEKLHERIFNGKMKVFDFYFTSKKRTQQTYIFFVTLVGRNIINIFTWTKKAAWGSPILVLYR